MFKFLRNTIYVQIKPDWLSVLHVESGNRYADIPVLAIDHSKDKAPVVAVGSQAESMCGRAGVIVVNGFQHPRTLIADWTSASKTLKIFIKNVQPNSLILPNPVIVIHPLAMLEGGLTQVEERALLELGFSAGARLAFVWDGAELSTEILSTIKFPPKSGQALLL